MRDSSRPILLCGLHAASIKDVLNNPSVSAGKGKLFTHEHIPSREGAEAPPGSRLERTSDGSGAPRCASVGDFVRAATTGPLPEPRVAPYLADVAMKGLCVADTVLQVRASPQIAPSLRTATDHRCVSVCSRGFTRSTGCWRPTPRTLRTRSSTAARMPRFSGTLCTLHLRQG